MKYPWLEINYWRGEKGVEVDFLVKVKGEPIYAIQASYNIESEETERRELKALRELNKKIKVNNLVVTRDQNYEKKNIRIVSFPKFIAETLREVEEKAEQI